MSDQNFLFSYGTLKLDAVQIKNYGRKLKGEKDRLLGYVLKNIEVKDKDVITVSGEKCHPIAVKTVNSQNHVDGYVFEITNQEIKLTDSYEVSDYIRIIATLESGKKAWVYVAKNDF